jgi:hypothetical protein
MYQRKKRAVQQERKVSNSIHRVYRQYTSDNTLKNTHITNSEVEQINKLCLLYLDYGITTQVSSRGFTWIIVDEKTIDCVVNRFVTLRYTNPHAITEKYIRHNWSCNFHKGGAWGYRELDIMKYNLGLKTVKGIKLYKNDTVFMYGDLGCTLEYVPGHEKEYIGYLVIDQDNTYTLSSDEGFATFGVVSEKAKARNITPRFERSEVEVVQEVKRGRGRPRKNAAVANVEAVPPSIADKVMALVNDTIKSQTEKGLAKYGVVLTQERQGEQDWCQHATEELVDALQYVQMAKERIKHLESELAANGKS